jgi:alcohol dehydrogenase
MDARTLYFTGPEEVEVRTESLPEPATGEVRVRTETSAISPGTELLLYEGKAPKGTADDDPIDALPETFEFPFRYGYAAVGRVTDAGDDVSDEWVGETVFAYHPHQSHFTVAPERLIRLPESCSVEEGAFLANAECAVNFLMDGRPVVGERVAVFGQGVVGLMTASLLAEHPLESLTTVDLYERRRDLSETFGADAALDPQETDVVERLRGDDEPGGTDLAYELTGDPDALDQAIAAMAFDSRLVIGSWYGSNRATLDLGGRFHRNRGTLVSSQVSTIDPQYAGRWSKERRLEVARDILKEVDVTELITHRVPIERAPEAYELLDERPQEAVQVLLTYE